MILRDPDERPGLGQAVACVDIGSRLPEPVFANALCRLRSADTIFKPPRSALRGRTLSTSVGESVRHGVKVTPSVVIQPDKQCRVVGPA